MQARQRRPDGELRSARRPSKVDEILGARGTSKRWLAKKLGGMDEAQLNRYLSGTDRAPGGFYERVADILHLPLWAVQPDETAGATTLVA